jgi:hypothetical protein
MPDIPAVPTYLANYQSVVDVFGKWPAFHDSEVISVLLERRGILFGEIHNARIEMAVLSFDLISCEGELSTPCVHHTLVHFAFDNVSEVKLEGFNHQNALYDLGFQEMPLGPSGNLSFRVLLDSALGLGGQFIASTGKVISIQRCDKSGNVTK